MTAKVFEITRKKANQDFSIMSNINAAILKELKAGRPVYASIGIGRFKGTIARLIIGKNNISDLSDVFYKKTYGSGFTSDLIWDLEVDGQSRKYKINWRATFDRDWTNKNSVNIYIGWTNGTILNRVELGQHGTLLDFMGKEIQDGDYVLMHNTSKEIRDTGSPFRMLRYTGKRSDVQATFTYVSLKDGTHNPDGGQQIRVGLNAELKDANGVSNQVYGVKVSVDESLAVAMQMTDHDMSLYPINFHIGME